MDAEIRTAAPADAAAVLALWAIARTAHAVTPDDEAAVEGLLARDPSALLVAKADGRVIGALIAAWDGWRGNMYRLAVLPEARRRGLALALVRAGEARLRERGARRVTALVGRGDDAAEALWTAAGYDYDLDVGRWVRSL